MQLDNIGITDVKNTGYPTMWGLSREFVSKIPRGKASKIVTSVTNYHINSKFDKEMLEMLLDNYHDVSV